MPAGHSLGLNWLAPVQKPRAAEPSRHRAVSAKFHSLLLLKGVRNLRQ